jgi:hypothetical protein
MAVGASGGSQMPHNVAVGIEKADFRNGCRRQHHGEGGRPHRGAGRGARRGQQRGRTEAMPPSAWFWILFMASRPKPSLVIVVPCGAWQSAKY